MKLIGLILTVWFCALPFELFAGWQFSQRIAITGAAVEATYHHLEGAGRKHIAVSGNKVAVLWEDNSSADPQIYIAIKDSRNCFRVLAGGEVCPGQASIGKRQCIVQFDCVLR